MRFAERFIELQGFVNQFAALTISFLRRDAPLFAEKQITFSETHIGQSEAGVLLDGSLEVLLSQFDPLVAPILGCPAGSQIVLVGALINGWRCVKSGLLVRRQLNLNLIGDGLCYFTVEFQNIAQFAIVIFGPEVLV